MARFAGEVLTKYIAPGILSFRSADMPDMSSYNPESSHWVSNHFLNTVLRGSLQMPAGAYVSNYLRRAEGAFSEHDRARSATTAFLQSERQSPSLYAEALLHWEFFAAQSWQGYALLQKLIQLIADDRSFLVFSPRDGTVEQRLWLLYNAMKHVEKRIASGQILDETVAPVWLSDRGLECTDGHLEFAETGDVLRDLAKWADIVVDPIDMANKLRSTASES